MTRQGRRAPRVPSGWQPDYGPAEEVGQPLLVRFRPANPEDRSADFDFARLGRSPALQAALAAGFAVQTAPTGSWRTHNTAKQAYYAAGSLLRYLDSLHLPPATGAEVSAVHVRGWRLTVRAGRMRGVYSLLLRRMNVVSPFLNAAATAVLHEPQFSSNGESEEDAYSDEEYRALVSAAQKDVRGARDRIRAARALLERHRAGLLLPDDDADLARGLSHLQKHHAFADDSGSTNVEWQGQQTRMARMLHLSPDEATSVAVLMVAYSAMNWSTVSRMTAESFTSTGEGEELLQIVPTNKPRRGVRSRAHTPLEGSDFGRVPAQRADEIRTANGLWRLVKELTEDSRAALNSDGLIAYWTVGGTASKHTNSKTHGLGRFHQGAPEARPRWAAAHPQAPALNARRLRKTVQSRTQRPVHQTQQTLEDKYLLTDPKTMADSMQVVAEVLREQVAAAQHHQQLTIITKSSAVSSSLSAALGISEDSSEALLAGQQDTVAAACLNHLDSPQPGARPGAPCPVSFLMCLDCRNAVVLERHLPAVMALRAGLHAAKAEMPIAVWVERLGKPWGQVEHIIGQFSAAQRVCATERITTAISESVDRLLARRLDVL